MPGAFVDYSYCDLCTCISASRSYTVYRAHCTRSFVYPTLSKSIQVWQSDSSSPPHPSPHGTRPGPEKARNVKTLKFNLVQPDKTKDMSVDDIGQTLVRSLTPLYMMTYTVMPMGELRWEHDCPRMVTTQYCDT
ncbi:hypothetical protein WMY93_028654 [Mugilogobius chulae]|uniref:Uncharacterized protein n=1 Tax=Mugilogobius chulae TaxID=88201 RepID=A0AAW0MQV0_9GOBI